MMVFVCKVNKDFPAERMRAQSNIVKYVEHIYYSIVIGQFPYPLRCPN